MSFRYQALFVSLFTFQLISSFSVLLPQTLQSWINSCIAHTMLSFYTCFLVIPSLQGSAIFLWLAASHCAKPLVVSSIECRPVPPRNPRYCMFTDLPYILRYNLCRVFGFPFLLESKSYRRDYMWTFIILHTVCSELCSKKHIAVSCLNVFPPSSGASRPYQLVFILIVFFFLLAGKYINEWFLY